MITHTTHKDLHGAPAIQYYLRRLLSYVIPFTRIPNPYMLDEIITCKHFCTLLSTASAQDRVVLL